MANVAMVIWEKETTSYLCNVARIKHGNESVMRDDSGCMPGNLIMWIALLAALSAATMFAIATRSSGRPMMMMMKTPSMPRQAALSEASSV